MPWPWQDRSNIKQAAALCAAPCRAFRQVAGCHSGTDPPTMKYTPLWLSDCSASTPTLRYRKRVASPNSRRPRPCGHKCSCMCVGGGCWQRHASWVRLCVTCLLPGQRTQAANFLESLHSERQVRHQVLAHQPAAARAAAGAAERTTASQQQGVRAWNNKVECKATRGGCHTMLACSRSHWLRMARCGWWNRYDTYSSRRRTHRAHRKCRSRCSLTGLCSAARVPPGLHDVFTAGRKQLLICVLAVCGQ